MIGLISSLAGSAMSGLFGMMGQNSANAAAQSMAANRYQTATADMTKAGLNPAMMFGSGGPAPMAPVQNPMAAPAAAMKDAASSAVQMNIADKTIDQLTEQIAKTNAEAANIRATTPALEATSRQTVREADAIRRVPDRIFVPVVQGGYGADKLKSTGRIGAAVGGGLSSAKSAAIGGYDTAKDIYTSARSWARSSDKSDEIRAARKRAEWKAWFSGRPVSGGSTHFQQ